MKYLKKYLRVWMLPILVLILCLSLTNCTHTELVSVPRTIEVTGSSEMAVQPDQIKLEIVIDTKTGVNKESKFLKILNKNGVTDDKIAFESANNYNWHWYYSNYYNRSEQKYTITLDSTVNSLQLMEDLKLSWVRSINVTDRTNSEIQEYRKQVKVQAVKSAKEKAGYMLLALDEEIGRVISVEEINADVNKNDPYYYWNQNNQNNVLSNSMLSSYQSNQGTVQGVAMQTLRHEVKIVFEIK
tara:strand:- start:227 stop:952 length:726 start_codon:yes stop_codon:yes gene_type:complete